MNLFYEEYPDRIEVDGELIPIVTDFRNYIKLTDMIKDEATSDIQKATFILSFFKTIPLNIQGAVGALIEFANMKMLVPPANEEDENAEKIQLVKKVYSFRYDYAYILSGFLQCYHIDLETVDYLHWWKFRCLFNGLSEDTEIKQRIKYRSIDVSTIKNKEEKKRILQIQREIKIPDEETSDYEIGNAFM